MRKMFPSKQTEQYLGSGKWHCVVCQKSQPFTGLTDSKYQDNSFGKSFSRVH